MAEFVQRKCSVPCFKAKCLKYGTLYIKLTNKKKLGTIYLQPSPNMFYLMCFCLKTKITIRHSDQLMSCITGGLGHFPALYCRKMLCLENQHDQYDEVIFVGRLKQRARAVNAA